MPASTNQNPAMVKSVPSVSEVLSYMFLANPVVSNINRHEALLRFVHIVILRGGCWEKRNIINTYMNHESLISGEDQACMSQAPTTSCSIILVTIIHHWLTQLSLVNICGSLATYFCTNFVKLYFHSGGLPIEFSGTNLRSARKYQLQIKSKSNETGQGLLWVSVSRNIAFPLLQFHSTKSQRCALILLTCPMIAYKKALKTGELVEKVQYSFPSLMPPWCYPDTSVIQEVDLKMLTCVPSSTNRSHCVCILLPAICFSSRIVRIGVLTIALSLVCYLICLIK